MDDVIRRDVETDILKAFEEDYFCTECHHPDYHHHDHNMSIHTEFDESEALYCTTCGAVCKYPMFVTVDQLI